MGIRIVKDSFCQKIIQSLNAPIISTSANISGQQQARCFAEISEEIKKSVDHIVNLHKMKKNKTKAQPSLS